MLDRRDGRASAAVHAAPELLHRQRREEALDQVDPRARRRREVHVVARAAEQPALHLVGLARRGAVEDEVHVEVRGEPPAEEAGRRPGAVDRHPEGCGRGKLLSPARRRAAVGHVMKKCGASEGARARSCRSRARRAAPLRGASARSGPS